MNESRAKQPNPCSNHEIHVLFERAFDLKILKTGLGFIAYQRCGSEWSFCLCFC